jgi:hypothetical protein
MHINALYNTKIQAENDEEKKKELKALGLRTSNDSNGSALHEKSLQLLRQTEHDNALAKNFEALPMTQEKKEEVNTKKLDLLARLKQRNTNAIKLQPFDEDDMDLFESSDPVIKQESGGHATKTMKKSFNFNMLVPTKQLRKQAIADLEQQVSICMHIHFCDVFLFFLCAYL